MHFIAAKHIRTDTHAGYGISLSVLLMTAFVALTGLTTMPTANATLPTDNGKIVFVSNRDGNNEIYSMNADGSEQIRLTIDSADDLGPSWSPDSTKIAFASNRDGNYDIYVMNADGSEQIRLTTNLAADSDPSWSPDGSKIAFTSDRDGNSEIYVMDADGSGQLNLTNNTVTENFADWSPDGTMMVFVSNREGNSEMYTMNMDGSSPTKLFDIQSLPGPARADTPVWSPDGSKIAFMHIISQRFTYYSILVVDADGTNITSLPLGSFSNPIPSWSPDGSRMAFSGASIAYEPLSTEDAEIYVISSNGTGLKALTDNEASDTDPDWGMPSSIQQLTIKSTSLSGRTLDMWTTIRTLDGTLLESGFTPLTFVGNYGAEYKVSVANYFGKTFQYWQDDESTSKSRIIALTSDTTLTAVYQTGVIGYTPINVSGRGTIIVNAVSLGDGRTLHMWTIALATQHEAITVKVHNYKDLVFDHWEDGRTGRIRSVADAPPQILTAYYRTG